MRRLLFSWLDMMEPFCTFSPPLLPLQLVWAPLLDELAAGQSLKYEMQRWPTSNMPGPGQEGYLDSLLPLQQVLDRAEQTWRATDASLAGNATAGGSGGSRYYRILALASSGHPLAATRPAQPVVAEGELVVAEGALGGCG